MPIAENGAKSSLENTKVRPLSRIVSAFSTTRMHAKLVKSYHEEQRNQGLSTPWRTKRVMRAVDVLLASN